MSNNPETQADQQPENKTRPPKPEKRPLTEEELLLRNPLAKSQRSPEEEQERRERTKRAVREWSARLDEENDQLMRRIIQTCGFEFAQEQYNRTLAILNSGGMYTIQGDRERTPGGIFFYMCRLEMGHDERMFLFPLPYISKPFLSYYPAWKWEERETLYQLALEDMSNLQHIEVEFLSKKSADFDEIVQVVAEDAEQGRVTLRALVDLSRTGSFPRGLPSPPPNMLQQWHTIKGPLADWQTTAEALSKGEKDRLRAVGIFLRETATGAIVFYAREITSERLRKRAKQKEAKAAAKAEKAAKSGKGAKGGKGAKPGREKDGKGAKPGREKGDKAAKPAKAAKGGPAIPKDVVRKVKELRAARASLQARLASSSGAGAAMTKKLLQNTERQLQQLEQQYPGV